MLPVIVYDKDAAECKALCDIVRGYLCNKTGSSLQLEAFTSSEEKALDYIRSDSGICILVIGFHGSCEDGIRLFRHASCLNRDHYILPVIRSMEQIALVSENCLRPAGILLKSFTMENTWKIMAQIEDDYINLQTEKNGGFIVINNELGTHRILSDSIIYIEAIEKKVLIWTQNQSYSLRGTLTQLMQLLPADRFLRCHRSFIVNVSKVTSVDYRDACLALESGDSVYFARSSKNEIRKVFSSSAMRSDAIAI